MGKIIEIPNYLVEEGGGVLIKALEDIMHERLANEFAAVLHRIFVAVALQRPHLAVVQRDGYSMCPTLFHGWVWLQVDAQPNTVLYKALSGVVGVCMFFALCVGNMLCGVDKGLLELAVGGNIQPLTLGDAVAVAEV